MTDKEPIPLDVREFTLTILPAGKPDGAEQLTFPDEAAGRSNIMTPNVPYNKQTGFTVNLQQTGAIPLATKEKPQEEKQPYTAFEQWIKVNPDLAELISS